MPESRERPVDELDFAAELEMAERDAGIAACRRQLVGASLWQCRECGAEIPAARRALGGVTLCVDCANELEIKRKPFAR